MSISGRGGRDEISRLMATMIRRFSHCRNHDGNIGTTALEIRYPCDFRQPPHVCHTAATVFLNNARHGITPREKNGRP
jgi:hypothetical protein